MCSLDLCVVSVDEGGIRELAGTYISILYLDRARDHLGRNNMKRTDLKDV